MESYRALIKTFLKSVVEIGADPYVDHDGKTAIDLLRDASAEADPQFKAYFSDLAETIVTERNEFLKTRLQACGSNLRRWWQNYI